MAKTCPCVMLVDMLKTVHLAEWWSSIFAAGFGLVLIVWGNRLSMGVFQGTVVTDFSQFALAYSWFVFVAGLLGLLGLAVKHRRLRMLSAMMLFASLGWLPLYYYWSVPIPWQGVWVYAAHALLEGAIYVRVKHGLDKGWF